MASLLDIGPPAAPTMAPSWASIRRGVLAVQAAPGGFRCAICRRVFASLDVVERAGKLVGICRSDRVSGPRGKLKQRQREVRGTRRRKHGWAGMGEGAGI